MIHRKRILPSAAAWNISTALRPGPVAISRACQNLPVRSMLSGVKFICAANWSASPPTSRPPMALGWPVIEKGPMPSRASRPVARWQLMMTLHLSVPVADWLTPWE